MTETTDPQAALYRHRTTEVEAVQWTGSNAEALRAFAGADFDEIELDDRVEDPDQTAAVREADHGTWRGLKPGDWVVKIDGGLYEFSAADFAKQYEPAAVPSAPADRAALRDRIAEVIHADLTAHKVRRDQGLLGIVPRLTDAVLAVLPATVDRAELAKQTGLRDYWHQEAMSATTRIIELEGQLEELRRMADEAQQPETQAAADVFELPGPDVVAYRNPDRPGVLLCREHGDGWWGLTPLTSGDLPDGGTCTYGDPADPDDVCGTDVLIPQQPKEA